MDLTICIRFGAYLTPKEICASISFGHDPLRTDAMPTISVSVFRFLDFGFFLPQAGPFDRI